jgi:hypothetical protein
VSSSLGGDPADPVGALWGREWAGRARLAHVPVRVGGGDGALAGLVAGRLAEEGVVVETSALTERCARERHARCRRVTVEYQPCCLVFGPTTYNVRYCPHFYCPHCGPVSTARATTAHTHQKVVWHPPRHKRLPRTRCRIKLKAAHA